MAKEESLAGKHGKTHSEIKADFAMDGKVISKLNGELKVVLTTLESINKTLKEVTTNSAKAASAMGGVNTGQGAAPAKAANGQPTFQNSSPTTAPGAGGAMGSILGRFGIGGGGVGGGGAGGGGNRFGAMGTFGAIYAAQQVGNIVSAPIRAADARIDNNRQYSISADRLSVEMQQRHGMSMIDVASQFRKPLGEYRLGEGGINQMLQFQNQTGVSASQQANSVAGVRALTGFSMGSGDVLSMMQSNLDPATANRQFMMMGGSNMYNLDGSTRDYMSVLQERSKMFNLNDPNITRGAKRAGSVTRYRMDMAGISQEEQDTLIAYGESSQQFAKKGGKGAYDPNNAQHQKLMGIDDNFATQTEESDRLRAVRDENMYRRQADNYSDLEKSNQALIKAMGSLEDTMSGLIGARASTRPFQKFLGNALQIGGVAAMAFGGPLTPWGAAGAGAMMAGSAMSGDPTDSGSSSAGTPASGSKSSPVNDANIMVPLGGTGQKKSLTDIKARSDFQQMHPKMQDRLLSAMREHPALGWGGGFRSSAAQESMFLSRYEPTSEDTGVKWKGQNWKRVRGAAAAPPGRSMHEIGLAADMAGDVGWLVRNASRFGLKTFENVNNEPWHVQPVELPNSRRQYEEQGAAWGSNGDFEDDAVFTEVPGTSGTEPSEHSGGGGVASGGLGGPQDFTGQSISSIISALTATQSMGGGGGVSRRTSSSKAAGTVADATGRATPKSGSGALAAAQAAYNAGFRGDALATIVALAGRESRWDSGAINPNSADRGMWQINFGSLQKDNKALMERLGVTKDTDLLDLDTNAKAAFAMYQAGGWLPWRGSDASPYAGGGPGWDRNGDHMWRTNEYVGEAQAAAAAVSNGTGDPTERGGAAMRKPLAHSMVSNGGGVSTNTHVTHAPVLEFKPTIQFVGHPETPDLRKIASTLGDMLREEATTLSMRND